MTDPPGSPWDILGIERTEDVSQIRRAYARQLKALRLDVDPEAFQRLRAARTRALALTTVPRGNVSTDEIPPKDQREDKGSPRLDDSGEPLVERLRQTSDDDAAVSGTSRVVEIAPLFESEHDRIAAARLKSEMTACFIGFETGNGVDTTVFERLLRQATMLPRVPRREVETMCLSALTRGWRKADGTLDPVRVAAIGPLLRAADDAFGWSGDDEALTETLSAQDADAVNLMLDEATFSSRAARMPAALRMRPADAHAFFSNSKRSRGLFEKAVAIGAMPWRPNIPAMMAPPLWAYYHRLWRELTLLYVLVCLPSLILVSWNGRPNDAVVAGLAALFLVISLGSGLIADRLLFAAALRAVKRADARGLFDRAKRETYLSTKTKLPTFVFVVYLFLPAAFPYKIVQELFVRLPF